MTVPAIYHAQRSRLPDKDRKTADTYFHYTTIGDPPADSAIDALSRLPPETANGFVTQAIEHGPAAIPNAPRELRSLFKQLPLHPCAPLDPSDARAAYRAFHSQSDVFIPAFFSATLRNASTLIARSFHATGRVTSAQALTRIRHNTHHLYEIMLPGSLDRDADGWKLSARIRLVHAQIRYLLRRSGRWDEPTFGTPLNAAHLALASANFSATILAEATRMGALLNPAARRGYMQVWHNASTIIGVPHDLLFGADERETRRFSRIAHLCEPAPDRQSIEIAHALINALPDMTGDTTPEIRTSLVNRAYRVSRALLGHPLADALAFPPSRSLAVLPAMRVERLLQTALHALAPRRAAAWQADRTRFLLEHAVLPDFDYRLPSIRPALKER